MEKTSLEVLLKNLWKEGTNEDAPGEYPADDKVGIRRE